MVGGAWSFCALMGAPSFRGLGVLSSQEAHGLPLLGSYRDFIT